MSLFGQPFGTNYTDLQNQYLQQLQVMQQAQQAQQKTQPILDEINREVGSCLLTSRTYWLKHKNIKWLNRPMRQDLWHS